MTEIEWDHLRAIVTAILRKCAPAWSELGNLTDAYYSDAVIDALTILNDPGRVFHVLVTPLGTYVRKNSDDLDSVVRHGTTECARFTIRWDSRLRMVQTGETS